VALALRSIPPETIQTVLASVLSSTDYGVLFTDLNHVSVACNRRFGQIFGVEIEGVVSQDVDTVRQMVKRRIVDLDHWQRNLEDVYADPMATQTDELQLRLPDCVLRRYTGPVLNETGEVLGRLWTFLDISEETRRLRMQEVLHEAALYCDVDPRRVYRFLTETVGEYYGSISLLSIRQGDFMEFRAVGGPDSPARGMLGSPLADAYCHLCLETDAPVLIQDARLDDATRNLLPARLGLTRYAGIPVRSPGGTIVGTLCIKDDRSHEPLGQDDVYFLSVIAMRISGELEREDKLNALETNLSDTQETLAKTQARLVESEKLAVTGTLAASVAHDIRNILSSLSLELDMADENPREALTYVRTQLDRFNVLSHRLLSYAKPRGFARQPVNMHVTLQNVLSLLSGQLRVSQVCVETRLDCPCPEVAGEPGRLEHVFVNIIVNALQAMGGGGSIRLESACRNRHVTIDVIDSGPGIPPALRDRLFEPFITSRQDGFGLGLYSCRQIVEDHQGHIELVPSERGAHFRISIPCNS
jgi:signal transduction histidine kinase